MVATALTVFIVVSVLSSALAWGYRRDVIALLAENRQLKDRKLELGRDLSKAHEARQNYLRISRSIASSSLCCKATSAEGCELRRLLEDASQRERARGDHDPFASARSWPR